MLKVTLIGCGGLGSALARGLSESPWVTLTVCEKHHEKVVAALPDVDVAFEADPAAAVASADVIVVAVKPGAVPGVLEAIDGALPEGSLTVSCAAGLPLQRLAAHQRRGALARAMPNTGASVKACTTAVVLGARAENDRDLKRLQGIFGAIGEMRVLPKEELMHAATAVAGSGPAFCLLVLESLMDAGVAAGLSRADAEAYARGAMRAASALADEGADPASLRAHITSPGGVTAAGLGALERAGVRAGLWDAVEAAVERSREMAEEG